MQCIIFIITKHFIWFQNWNLRSTSTRDLLSDCGIDRDQYCSCIVRQSTARSITSLRLSLSYVWQIVRASDLQHEIHDFQCATKTTDLKHCSTHGRWRSIIPTKLEYNEYGNQLQWRLGSADFKSIAHIYNHEFQYWYPFSLNSWLKLNPCGYTSSKLNDNMCSVLHRPSESSYCV